MTHSLPALLGVALGAAILPACKQEPTVTRVFAAHRVEVDRFVESVRAVEGQLASAPTATSGEALLAAKLDCSADPAANTTVMAAEDFGLVRGEHPEQARSHHNAIYAEMSSPLATMLYLKGTLLPGVALPASQDRDRGEIDYAEVSIAAIGHLRYLAVARPEVVADYDEADLTRPAKWVGNVVVWDLSTRAWIGRVGVTVSAGPATPKAFALRNTKTRELGPAGVRPQETVSDGRGLVCRTLHEAISAALTTGKDVTRVQPNEP